MDDFLFRGRLASLDPDVAALVDLEALRQVRKLIMIPSEASIPEAVREAVGSVFGNIYAEGYPPEEWRFMGPHDLAQTDLRLAEFRRYGSPRYYRGTEMAELVESLARRRTAERFANERVSADKLYVNVQPLSGAPANSAVYTAFAKPGDTIMGLNLLDGGHLTHGSPVNRSGLFFNVVAYGVRPDDERLDYEQMRRLALEHRPKFIIAGFTSYPWAPDWALIREIADEAGSLVLADVSHVAGLIIAGQYPSPVGIADIISFTTHKTLAGPRGAVLMTHKADLARKLDKAVFPGEQGGPHVNSIAGLAVAMKLAGTPEFQALQKQIVVNARVMAETFQQQGIRVPYGGTDTHMVLIDVGQIKGRDGAPLSGDIAARLIDLAGVTANRNTIPGDKSPFRATGVRFGTTWVTQRGLKEPQMIELTHAISTLLHATHPFGYAKAGSSLEDWRAKVDFDVFNHVQQRLGRLAERAGIDYEVPSLAGYPNEADAAEEHFRVLPRDDDYALDWKTLHVYGEAAGRFLEAVLTIEISDMASGQKRPAYLLNAQGVEFSRVVLEKLSETTYLLHVEENADLIAQWLTQLSDGYILFDPHDLEAKIPGPVSVSPMPHINSEERIGGVPALDQDWLDEGIGIDAEKAYFIGCRAVRFRHSDSPLPAFQWSEPEGGQLLTTPLHGLHQELGAKLIPFAGYDMPVWYSSVMDEHLAVRNAAGVFDVTHMGVLEASGPGAENFLNALTSNDVSLLQPGEAHYSYLLGVDGIPLDDIYIYRQSQTRFMVVVNASNNDKNWAWLQAVLAGEVCIDSSRPWVKAPGRAGTQLRDLRAASSGADRRVDLALQGPDSQDVLLMHFQMSAGDKAKLKKLAWSQFTQVRLDDFDLIISRTGYTGERTAYELFVHPDRAADLFRRLIEAGVTPCGLAARDSLRIEAGLPLYGHELGGDLGMNPADAGFTSYVKTWKPFFVGKTAYQDYEVKRDLALARFQVPQKGLRAPQVNDPITDARGRVIGVVTSCAVMPDGLPIGLAWLKESAAGEGAEVLIFAHASSMKADKHPADLRLGEKASVPQVAKILSRFPKKKK
jgi:glycine hydroxymethyltransferase